MTEAQIERDEVEGIGVHVLRSPAGTLQAAFAPEANLAGCSLRHEGEEVLGHRRGLRSYLETGSTMGIPLLHPWANRLSEPRYAAAGREVELDPGSDLLKADPNGLLIHGILPAALEWEVTGAEAGPAAAVLHARLGFEDRRLLEVFPYPHELSATVRLTDAALEIATTLRPTGDVPVPVSFGYHPYLAPPGAPRADWHVELPVARRVVLDDRGLPTGAREPVHHPSGPLGDRAFDDGYDDVPAGTTFVVEGGGRRIEVAFVEGYPAAQVYAPPDQDLIAIEPMTAVTDALRSGAGLALVEPGSQHRAAFSIACVT